MPRPAGPLARLVARAREVIAPRSLPDPPSAAPRRARRSVLDCVRLVAAGTRDYMDSWRLVGDAPGGADSGGGGGDAVSADDTAGRPPRDAAAASQQPGKASAADSATAAAAGAARAAVRGADALRPGLQHLFRSRAAAYRDAVFSFAEGYREGVVGGGGDGGGEGGDRAGSGPAPITPPPGGAATPSRLPAEPPRD